MRSVHASRKLKAYIVGLALGDGNLSNPNGRAVRLRITCDKKYSRLISYIKNSLQKFLPDNKVSEIQKQGGAIDISCYSNRWEKILGWKASSGSKQQQGVHIPSWILRSKLYIRECLRGLFQTDGSLYKDRGYTMVNLVSEIPALVKTVLVCTRKLGYVPNVQILDYKNGKKKYTIRISKNAKEFIKEIRLWKK